LITRDGQKGGAVPKFLLDRPEISEKDLEGKSEEEQQMMKMMGFGSFDSTKVGLDYSMISYFI
jgi:hypothetical protein